MKKWIALLIALVLLTGCSAPSDEFVLPTAGKAGGYQISNGRVDILVWADGSCKYVALKRDGSILKSYSDGAETVITEEKDGETTFYREAVGAEDLSNPLGRIFDGLEGMDFQKADGAGVYLASIHKEGEKTKSIPYTIYDIQMEWTDGKLYVYQYFLYENGECIVSVSAPDEINPILTKDTRWKHDIDQGTVRNEETGEAVGFTVTKTTQEEGPPPSGGEKETVVSELAVEVTLNRDGTAKTLRYIMESADLTIGILNDYTAGKPAVPETAREMTTDEAMDALLRLYAAESLV